MRDRTRPYLPVSSRFAERLDDRRHEFERWLSRWNMLGQRENFEIDSFGGQPIYGGNLAYSGTITDCFWEAICRGMRKEIVAQFEWLERQVSGKPLSHAEEVIEVCSGQLVTFAERIRRMAIDKDRRLRGVAGTLPSAADRGMWADGADRVAILRQAAGLIDSLKAGVPPVPPAKKSGLLQRFPAWVQTTSGVVTIVGGIAAALAFAIKFLG